jgi:hypothetical protein
MPAQPTPSTLVRAIGRAALFVPLLALLSGCVWLRLLDTKRQIEEFDRHFYVESGEHFVLHFLHPRLYSDDFVTLAGVKPSLVAPLAAGQRWRLNFRKIDAQGTATSISANDMAFDLFFNPANLLIRWDFPPEFLAMAPAEFLEASLRSLGKAEINEGKQQLSADASLLPRVKIALPELPQIVKTLGEPVGVENRPDGQLYVYRYLLDGEAVDAAHEKNRKAVVKLLFDPATRRLLKMSARIVGLKVSIDYRRFNAAG